MNHLWCGVALCLALSGTAIAAPAPSTSPIVLELFTSQSCSSCPPADALLQKLAADPSLLALSYHVTYWDDLGWKDPFSLPESTDRQRDYSQDFGQRNVYTPELVIDGRQGVTGSRRNDVLAAIAAARALPKPLKITITSTAAQQIEIMVSDAATPVRLWLITYSPQAVTAVRGGENSGRELTSINNVSAITPLPIEPGKPVLATLAGDSVSRYAVLAQAADGALIGAAAYTP